MISSEFVLEQSVKFDGISELSVAAYPTIPLASSVALISITFVVVATLVIIGFTLSILSTVATTYSVAKFNVLFTNLAYTFPFSLNVWLASSSHVFASVLVCIS